MNSNEIDWKNGEVTFWDLDELNPALPVDQQPDLLKEDLAQVRYANGLLIDLGWYPDSEASGKFRVVVIQNENWESPLFDETAQNLADLKRRLDRAVSCCAIDS